MRRPSPQLCMACFRLHVRLSSDARIERRSLLAGVLRKAPDDARSFAIDLFDHLTLAPKARERDEHQAHPMPVIPGEWTASGLELVTATVAIVAFDL